MKSRIEANHTEPNEVEGKNNFNYNKHSPQRKFTRYLKHVIFSFFLFFLGDVYSLSTPEPEHFSFSFQTEIQHSFQKVPPITLFEHDFTYIAIRLYPDTKYKINRQDSKSVPDYASFNGTVRTGVDTRQINLRFSKLSSKCYIHVAVFHQATKPTIYKNVVNCNQTDHEVPYASDDNISFESNDKEKEDYEAIQKVVERFKKYHHYSTYVHLNYAFLFESNKMDVASMWRALHFVINSYFASYQIIPGVQLVLEYVNATDPGVTFPSNIDQFPLKTALDQTRKSFEHSRLDFVDIAIYLTSKKLQSDSSATTNGLAYTNELFIKNNATILLSTYLLNTDTNYSSLYTSKYIANLINAMAHEVLHLFGALHLEGRASIMEPIMRGQSKLLHMSPKTQSSVFEVFENQCLKRRSGRPRICTLLPTKY